jgi:hypothetical protein
MCQFILTTVDMGDFTCSLALRGRKANGASLDEFCLGEGLAPINFSLADVCGPIDDSANDGSVVPADVSDRGSKPVEGLIGIAANKRDVFRRNDSPAGEVVFDCVKDEGFINDESRGGSDFKKTVKYPLETVSGVFPFREIIGTDAETMVGHFVKDCLIRTTRTSRSLAFSGENHDALMA